MVRFDRVDEPPLRVATYHSGSCLSTMSLHGLSRTGACSSTQKRRRLFPFLRDMLTKSSVKVTRKGNRAIDQTESIYSKYISSLNQEEVLAFSINLSLEKHSIHQRMSRTPKPCLKSDATAELHTMSKALGSGNFLETMPHAFSWSDQRSDNGSRYN